MKNTFNSVARVEQLAARRGIAVSRLALECDVNPSTIATAKSRGCQLNLDTIIRICDHLDLLLDEFFRTVPTYSMRCNMDVSAAELSYETMRRGAVAAD